MPHGAVAHPAEGGKLPSPDRIAENAHRGRRKTRRVGDGNEGIVRGLGPLGSGLPCEARQRLRGIGESVQGRRFHRSAPS